MYSRVLQISRIDTPSQSQYRIPDSIPLSKQSSTDKYSSHSINHFISFHSKPPGLKTVTPIPASPL